MNEVAVRLAEPGDVVFRHACKLGFEGIVSKRLGSPYISGRSRTWLKFRQRMGKRTCSHRCHEMAVIRSRI